MNDGDLQQSAVDDRRAECFPEQIDIEPPRFCQIVGLVFVIEIVFPRFEMPEMIMGQLMGHKSHLGAIFILSQSLRVDPDAAISGDFRDAARNRCAFNN